MNVPRFVARRPTFASRRLVFVAAVLIAGRTAPGAFGAVSFEDVSGRIDFLQQSATTDEGLAGAAWFDCDGDGRLDLFVTNGRGSPNGLFLNIGDGKFGPNEALLRGVAGGLGNSGVVAGDLDNDGCPDLFLTGSGGEFLLPAQSPTRLYRNRRTTDGTCACQFDEVNAPLAAIPGGRTAWSAALGDVDGDGYLDVFITSPGSFSTGLADANKLYRNNHDLTFTDVSESAGVATKLGACAAGFTDVDGDGKPDILVANCNGVEGPAQPIATPFELFHNNGSSTFTNVAAGTALAENGFWMSATFGDYDNDGRIDVFAPSLGNAKTFAGGNWPAGLFRNNGDGTFSNTGADSGIDLSQFGWGATFADFDDDGHLDLFYTGSLPQIGTYGPGRANPGVIFFNDGTGHFAKGTLPVNMSFSYTSGVAYADFDNDGFPDIIVMRDFQAPLLLHNKGGTGNDWITVHAVGQAPSNRDAIGARVEIGSQVREIRAGSSFLSSESPWPTFGLGSHTGNVDVQVTWPSGRKEKFTDLATKQIVTLVEGKGAALAP